MSGSEMHEASGVAATPPGSQATPEAPVSAGSSPPVSIPNAFVTSKIRALLPRVIDRREMIRGVPDRWRAQYPDTKEEIAERLDALDLATASAADIATIIGNDSWTKIECGVCEEDRDFVVSIPREYELPIYICRECATGVLEMLAACLRAHASLREGTGR